MTQFDQDAHGLSRALGERNDQGRKEDIINHEGEDRIISFIERKAPYPIPTNDKDMWNDTKTGTRKFDLITGAPII